MGISSRFQFCILVRWISDRNKDNSQTTHAILWFNTFVVEPVFACNFALNYDLLRAAATIFSYARGFTLFCRHYVCCYLWYRHTDCVNYVKFLVGNTIKARIYPTALAISCLFVNFTSGSKCCSFLFRFIITARRVSTVFNLHSTSIIEAVIRELISRNLALHCEECLPSWSQGNFKSGRAEKIPGRPWFGGWMDRRVLMQDDEWR